MALFLGSLQLGLIYALLSLGIYISFRILDIPDLSAEGTFTFGLTVSAAVTLMGHPLLAIFLGAGAGFLGGFATGLFQTKLLIHPILAGILTMSGLYSVNIAVMGSSSNLSLVGVDTLFRLAFVAFPAVDRDIVRLIIAALFCLCIILFLTYFFRTYLGLSIRATGDNEAMVRASSIHVDNIKLLALGMSNACIGMSGALLAQYQGFADISSGVGIIAVGLASVIIGEKLFGTRGVAWGLCSVILGSIVYRLIVALALKSNLFPAYYLKLISALIVAIALAIPAIQFHMKNRAIKKRGLANAKNI